MHAKMGYVEEPSMGAAQRHARPWLRALAIIVPAVAFIAVLTIALARDSVPRPGDPAPDFSGRLLASEGTLSLSDIEGRPAVINFWASWCVPCEDEAPLLRAAYERYGDSIAFVGVDIRDARSDALAFVRRHRLDYPHIRDENSEISNRFGLTGQPETFFLSATGEIVEHVPGPLFEGDLEVLLQRVLAADG